MTGLELCIIIKTALTGMISPYQQKVACRNAGYIVQQSEKRDIDPLIVASVIYVESSFSPRVVSKAGACGLMQVLPKYSRYSCEQLKNPRTGIKDGIRALNWWLSWTKGDMDKSLCGYNAGTKCVTKPNSKFARRVRRGYVRKVKTIHKLMVEASDKSN